MAQWLKLTTLSTAAISTVAIVGAGMAQAQTTADETMFGTQTAAGEVSDLQDAIEDDAERDPIFSNREVGTYGSAALRAISSNSADATVDDVTTVGLGVQFGNYDGRFGNEVNLSYTYAETNGDVSKNTLAMTYGFTMDMSPRLFAFANADVKFDQLAELASQTRRDGYIGGGLGYRVIDNADLTFDVKAGPGYRYIENGAGGSVNEAAYSVGASYNQQLTDGVALYDDLALIGSDSDTTITNEIGVSVAMSDKLSLRTSYRSEFRGPDFNGLDNTENTTGIAVVYSFN